MIVTQNYSLASMNAATPNSFAGSLDSQSNFKRSMNNSSRHNKKEFKSNGMWQIGQLLVGPGILGYGTAGTILSLLINHILIFFKK